MSEGNGLWGWIGPVVAAAIWFALAWIVCQL
jgi:hypothetical protein